MSLIEKLINRKSFLCIFSFSLSFDVVVSWFVVTGDDGSHLFIFTATLPQMHKHIHIQPQIHTPLLLRTKLTGHILGLRAPCGYILAVLGLETPYLHSVSYLSSGLSYGKGTLRAYYFIGWQNNMLPSSYESKVVACDSVQSTSK